MAMSLRLAVELVSHDSDTMFSPWDVFVWIYALVTVQRRREHTQPYFTPRCHRADGKS